MLVVIIIVESIIAKKLKLKNDRSCSLTSESKYRVWSLFIGEYVISLTNEKPIKDCFTDCYNSAECEYFAHKESTQSCLHFKNIINKEAISRLIFEGWKFGRVDTNKKV